MTGWRKVSGVCEYTETEKRTIRSWLKAGLKHSRLPSGMILIRLADIDDYLDKFAVTEAEGSKLDKIVHDVLKEAI